MFSIQVAGHATDCHTRDKTSTALFFVCERKHC